MKDKKMIVMALGAIVLLVAIGGFLIFGKKTEESKKEPTADALRFKEEYEKLNGTIRESDGATYNSVEIPEDNPMKYVSAKEALDVLKNETAIIYVGADWCPWCRNAVPVLIDVAKSRNIDTIYYLNLDSEKDVYEIQDGKLVKTTEGTEAYYEFLDFMSDYLRDYVLTDSKGKEYEVGEKRVYIPFIIAAKDGKVVDTTNETFTLNEGQTKYDKLTEDQRKGIYDNYQTLFKKIYANSTCNDDCN